MFDAIVPAGGSARRLDGADKPGLIIDGRALLDHVLVALARAQRVIVVGPARPTEREVRWCREDPAGGGPVAAIAAALHYVTASTCLLVAADLPRIGGAIEPLRSALADHEAAVLASDGRHNYLAAAWRTDALRHAVTALGQTRGAAVRALHARKDIVTVDDTVGWGRDCDTWSDLAALTERANR